MIKDAMKHIESLAAPTLQDIGGRMYTNKPLTMVPQPVLGCLTVHTLSAIVNYINGGADAPHISQDLMIHIEDHSSVYLYDAVNSDKARVPILRAVLNDVSPKFSNWYDTESFNIVMQSRFIQNEHSTVILKMVGNLVKDNSVGTTDDGVTQKVTVKNGISLVGTERVPNPVSLIPYRTFTEAVQPESKFVFRLRDSRDCVEAALYEADGGAWINEAIQNIHNYFLGAVDPVKLRKVTILA